MIIYMPKVLDQAIYDRARAIADETYKKPSAYKSGFIVKKYKELGGRYADDGKQKPLARWYKEKWGSIGGSYPTYRPTVRVSSKTPLTSSEIDPKNAKKQIALKQRIKGGKNLPPFVAKIF